MAGRQPAREDRPYYHDYSDDERERERRHRRRHRHHEEYDDDVWVVKRDRRERRETAGRRAAEVDIDDLRNRRTTYYSRPEAERHRDSQRMAQESLRERAVKPRDGYREVRRDGTRRRKKREVVRDDRSEDYVYGRPPSAVVIEEVTVKRSSPRRRSDTGRSSSQTEHSPLSGSRSPSTRRADPPLPSRSKSAREPSRPYMATRPSVRRHSTVKVASPTAMPPRKDPLQRRSTGGLLASLFGPPPRHTTTVFQKDVARVTCIVCMADDLPASKTAKLNCGHRRCNSCLQRQFLLSVNDPQQMPPRCCTNEHIPLKHVERLFNDKFKRTWNKKYQEYTTANRLYCPTKGCGEWIKPSKIRVDIYGRKFARCGRCHTKVCVLCNGKFHTRRDCPMDPETNRLVQIAKEKGWQRCYHCKAIVELKEGCNHMTCRCNAQFCMVCAAPWKTCNCPWFNYQHIEDEDRLDDMRIPQEREGGDMAEPPTSSPPLVRRISTRARNRSDRDRDAERADEVLAAHLHAQLNLDGTRTPSDVRRSDPGVQVYGLGNAGSHHMNESYRIRPLTVSVSRAPLQRAPPGWSSRQPSAPAARHVPSRPALVRASTMAGLSRDGSKRGANRVGTWLSHVQVDHEAIQTAPRHVEVDDWRMEGSVAGIP